MAGLLISITPTTFVASEAEPSLATVAFTFKS